MQCTGQLFLNNVKSRKFRGSWLRVFGCTILKHFPCLCTGYEGGSDSPGNNIYVNASRRNVHDDDQNVVARKGIGATVKSAVRGKQDLLPER